MINQAIVYKTNQANLIGQGLAGTVELRTVRPLDLKKRLVAFNVRGSTNDQKNGSGKTNTGNRLSFAYADQFDDGKVGVAFGYSHLDTPTSTRDFKFWGFDQVSDHPEWGGGAANSVTQFPAAHKNAYRFNGFEAVNNDRTQKRDGYMGVVEFKPNDNFHSVNDLYYSKFDQTDFNHIVKSGSGIWGGDTPVTYTNPVFSVLPNVANSAPGANEINVSGTVNNLRLIMSEEFGMRSDTMFSFGSNNTWHANGWNMVFDASTASVKRKEQAGPGGSEMWAGYGPSITPGAGGAGVVPIGFQMNGFGPMTFSQSLNYADATKVVLGDPANWGADGHIRFPTVEDKISQARFTGDHDLSQSAVGGLFSKVDMGVAWSNRQKSKTVTEFDMCLKGETSCGDNTHNVTISQDLLLPNQQFGWVGLGQVLSWDFNGALNKYYNLRQLTAANDGNTTNKNWKVSEQLVTSYAQFEINTNLGGIPVHGNVGAQYVNETQTSQGYILQQPTAVWYNKTTKYNDFLPSINLVGDLGGGTLLKVAAARQMARPRLDDMRADASVSYSPAGSGSLATVGVYGGSGGNPTLKPWRTDAFDVSLEHYFGKHTYIAGAAFTKKLNTYIYNSTIIYDFAGYPKLGANSGLPSVGYTIDKNGVVSFAPGGTTGLFSTPFNGKGGSVNGLEFSFSVDGTMFTPVLDGFGLTGNWNGNWSTIKPDGVNKTHLPGLSNSVADLTFFYEKNNWSARISERYRSWFLGEVPQLFSTRGNATINEDKQVDGQVSYDFKEGPIKGTTLLLQVYNLTNSPYTTNGGYFGGTGPHIPAVNETYGRTIIFGFNYKM